MPVCVVMWRTPLVSLRFLVPYGYKYPHTRKKKKQSHNRKTGEGGDSRKVKNHVGEKARQNLQKGRPLYVRWRLCVRVHEYESARMNMLTHPDCRRGKGVGRCRNRRLATKRTKIGEISTTTDTRGMICGVYSCRNIGRSSCGRRR